MSAARLTPNEVRDVLIEHLKLLDEGRGWWPADSPRALIADLSIGEYSSVEHCRQIVERVRNV